MSETRRALDNFSSAFRNLREASEILDQARADFQANPEDEGARARFSQMSVPAGYPDVHAAAVAFQSALHATAPMGHVRGWQGGEEELEALQQTAQTHGIDPGLFITPEGAGSRREHILQLTRVYGGKYLAGDGRSNMWDPQSHSFPDQQSAEQFANMVNTYYPDMGAQVQQGAAQSGEVGPDGQPLPASVPTFSVMFTHEALGEPFPEGTAAHAMTIAQNRSSASPHPHHVVQDQQTGAHSVTLEPDPQSQQIVQTFQSGQPMPPAQEPEQQQAPDQEQPEEQPEEQPPEDEMQQPEQGEGQAPVESTLDAIDRLLAESGFVNSTKSIVERTEDVSSYVVNEYDYAPPRAANVQNEMRDELEEMLNLYQNSNRRSLSRLAEAVPVDANRGVTSRGNSAYDKFTSPATREKVLQARTDEIIAFAKSRSLPMSTVYAATEASMRTGKVPDLGQYGLAGDDAVATKQFIISNILNIQGLEDVNVDGEVLGEADKFTAAPAGDPDRDRLIKLAKQAMLARQGDRGGKRRSDRGVGSITSNHPNLRISRGRRVVLPGDSADLDESVRGKHQHGATPEQIQKWVEAGRTTNNQGAKKNRAKDRRSIERDRRLDRDRQPRDLGRPGRPIRPVRDSQSNYKGVDDLDESHGTSKLAMSLGPFVGPDAQVLKKGSSRRGQRLPKMEAAGNKPYECAGCKTRMSGKDLESAHSAGECPTCGESAINIDYASPKTESSDYMAEGSASPARLRRKTRGARNRLERGMHLALQHKIANAGKENENAAFKVIDPLVQPVADAEAKQKAVTNYKKAQGEERARAAAQNPRRAERERYARNVRRGHRKPRSADRDRPVYPDEYPGGAVGMLGHRSPDQARNPYLDDDSQRFQNRERIRAAVQRSKRSRGVAEGHDPSFYMAEEGGPYRTGGAPQSSSVSSTRYNPGPHAPPSGHFEKEDLLPKKVMQALKKEIGDRVHGMPRAELLAVARERGLLGTEESVDVRLDPEFARLMGVSSLSKSLAGANLNEDDYAGTAKTFGGKYLGYVQPYQALFEFPTEDKAVKFANHYASKTKSVPHVNGKRVSVDEPRIHESGHLGYGGNRNNLTGPNPHNMTVGPDKSPEEVDEGLVAGAARLGAAAAKNPTVRKVAKAVGTAALKKGAEVLKNKAQQLQQPQQQQQQPQMQSSDYHRSETDKILGIDGDDPRSQAWPKMSEDMRKLLNLEDNRYMAPKPGARVEFKQEPVEEATFGGMNVGAFLGGNLGGPLGSYLMQRADQIPPYDASIDVADCERVEKIERMREMLKSLGLRPE